MSDPITATGRKVVAIHGSALLDDVLGIEAEVDALDAAWAEAEAALRPEERLVMWQDHGGPRFIQVLAPEKATDDDGEEVDDVMAPVISILADYPSKGLGDGVTVELRNLAVRLREAGR